MAVVYTLTVGQSGSDVGFQRSIMGAMSPDEYEGFLIQRFESIDLGSGIYGLLFEIDGVRPIPTDEFTLFFTANGTEYEIDLVYINTTPEPHTTEYAWIPSTQQLHDDLIAEVGNDITVVTDKSILVVDGARPDWKHAFLLDVTGRTEGAVDDMEQEWLQSKIIAPIVDNTVQGLYMQFFGEAGATSGEFNTASYEYLISAGSAPAALPEMWEEYWRTGTP